MLPWHLTADDAMLARRLVNPSAEPFTLLSSALRGDDSGLGATREARRRRYGIGAVQRRRRLTEVARLSENDLSHEARRRREQRGLPADRHALQRLMPGVQAPAVSPTSTIHWKAAVAVYAIIGANVDDDDVVHRTGWIGTRMQSRYVQSWIIHHRECDARDLIATLIDAVDRANAENCSATITMSGSASIMMSACGAGLFG